MEFTEFELHKDLLAGIAAAGYVTCTPVQEQVLKGSLDGADLYVQSQTGTGKTAAYLISIIQEMMARQDIKGKKALIMVPTRELAVQVEQEAKLLSSGTPLKAASFYGGVGYTHQTEMLKKEVDIIIGTPGRVIDLQESRTMDLSAVAFLVIDEADRMFDMGFYPDLRKLIKVLPPSLGRQTMLFSATLNNYVKNLAWEYTTNPREITIESDNVTVDQIDQILVHVASDDKMKLLLGIIKKDKPESLIVFCNTKRMCEVVAKRLKINRVESEFIIGDLPQSKRLQVLESFKRSSLACLVATDVAARGIDVNDLSMVINYDLPNEAENYVHRIGRTARAGKTGKAYTFCSEQDVYNLPAIERYIEMQLPSTMAGPDILAEDASAGMYIKTGDYGDDSDVRRDSRRDGRNSGRSRDSGGRSARGGRRDERDSRGRSQNRVRSETPSGSLSAEERSNEHISKPVSRIHTDRPHSSDAPRTERSARYSNNDNYQRRDKNRMLRGSDTKQTATSQQMPDLSALSFDERMKLYKEKYASSSNAGVKTAAGKTAQNAKTPQKNNTAQKSKPAAKKSAGAEKPLSEKKRTAPAGLPGKKQQPPAPVKGLSKTTLLQKVKLFFGIKQ